MAHRNPDPPMFYHDTGEPLCFAFLMLEGLSMLSLASATEPLRAANRLLGRDVFRWDLCSIDGQPVMPSSGIPFPAIHVDQAIERNHALFICGGARVDPQDERPYLAAMRRAAHRGRAIGALSTASYLLAKAGLLDGYRCTIHWENRAAFEEDFPHLPITGTLYEIDRNRLTCSGGTASMDLMLHIIADLHGRDLANGVANQFHHARIRDADESQQGGRMEQIGTLPESLQMIVRLMQANIETPLQIERLARLANVSERQMERNFRNFLGMTPARYYLSLRVERAREMLLYTEQPIIDIAIATGFASTSHFSKWVKEFYKIRPSEMREQARVARARSRRTG
ncbi:GlxA family transcriptional regulator [Paracoccus siganidrum]|uniref:GlxA family transcriptional regulator n=2 Tax=Paracoccus siganidrum TaxID=1276757 RepID=A0A419A5G8_9RHOB|nr:GlxA family transcriptional regulator [Paracoccus siganidrum]RJL10720.1 GlxA family transcriptional regulator [Paracoccus siganidrum]RMC28976.1 GlxA family transcriptional regulator [Paracoccus siganidrum]